MLKIFAGRPEHANHCALALALLLSLISPPLSAQAGSGTTQQLVFAGLRSLATRGQINAVKSDAAGDLYLLLDQGDGVRLLKTDPAGNMKLAEALLGSKGDSGLAMALDPSGAVYVAGSTSSMNLVATAGAAFSARNGTSTNSFVAKFGADLHPLFVTFTGGSGIVASSVAATSDAVFVAGVLSSADLPVTSNGVQQNPAFGSAQNGFVERFSTTGSTLVYATYLTGAAGDTLPTAIAADTSDSVYIVGSTSASGFPTIAALVPAMLSSPSGFLVKLTPGGDAVPFSTFVPGAGLTSIAMDSTGQMLLISGSIAPGQFPIDTVAMPLLSTTYQALLRIPLDGSSVESSTVIAPGTQSFVAAAGAGEAWVGGVASAPYFSLAPLSSIGLGFAARVNGLHAIDQVARFGGLPNANPTFASLPISITSIAVNPSGEVIVAGAVQPTASASLLASETYDLPLRGAPTDTLPSSVRDAETDSATCNGSLCAGSAAYLAKLNPNLSLPALTFSNDDSPAIVLRNLGSTEAQNLHLSAVGAALATNCGSVLYAGGECSILLSEGAAGVLTASTSNSPPQVMAFPAPRSSAAVSGIVFFPKEVDFGVQTVSGLPMSRTITISNLGTASETFVSAFDSAVRTTPFNEVWSDCPLAGPPGLKLLAPGASCHITIGFKVQSPAPPVGFVQGEWSIGSRDVLLNGYSQAADLSVSSDAIEFGKQFAGGIRLPRYLYLSNHSKAAVSHASVAMDANSPFAVSDDCPPLLPGDTVCRMRIDYRPIQVPSKDSFTLVLDQAISVLLTGEILPPRGVNGAAANPNLAVSPGTVEFADPVAVTSASTTTATVSISNTGASPFALSLALTGDFSDVTSCSTSLAGGQSCAVAIRFVPTQAGVRQGLLAVSTGSQTTSVLVSLTGTGSAILPSNNGVLDVGSTPVGQPRFRFFKVAQSLNSLAVSATAPYSVVLVEDTGSGPGQPASMTYLADTSGSCHNCFVGVQLKPTVAGSQPGQITLSSSTDGRPYTLALTGFGTPTTGLLLTPMNQDFGSVPVSSSSGRSLFTLTNLLASGAATTIANVRTSGDFLLRNTATGVPACGGSLAYTASCQVEVAFNPQSTGAHVGSLTFSSSDATATATLTGQGLADTGVSINPLALSFQNRPGGSARQQTVTVTNTSVSALQVGLPSLSSSNFAFASSCAALAPGETCSIVIRFRPGATTLLDTLVIPVTFVGAGGAPQLIPYAVSLAGSYTTANAGLQVVPGQTSFGPTPTGTQGQTRQFTINNLTAQALAPKIALPQQFVLAGAPCVQLAAYGSCSFLLTFVPLVNGDVSGTLVAQAVPSDGSSAVTSLAYTEGFGTGQGALTVSGGLIVQGLYDFGQVTSGQTSAQTFTLAHHGPASDPAITIRRVTSGPPFLSTTDCGALLDVDQSCTVTITYAPVNQVPFGTASPASTRDAGLLLIESDAASSPERISLSGRAGPVASGGSPNTVPLATFVLSQGSLTFAPTKVGNVSDSQSTVLTNTGTMAIHIASIYTPADFAVQSNCATVLTGASCSILVSSTPRTPGAHIGSLEIISDAAGSLEFVSLTSIGDAAALLFFPARLNFGSVLVGREALLPVQVTNTSTDPVVLNSITVSGDYTFAGSCPTLAGLLPAGSSCMAQVKFTPTIAGTRVGALSVASSASQQPLQLSLTGIGTHSKLLITPGSLDFGSVVLGASLKLTLNLANLGTAPVSGLALSVGGDYSVSIPCPVSLLAAGASCIVQLSFTPSLLGARPGTLLVASSDAKLPVAVPLSGVGVPGGSFLMSVDGAASATATVPSGQPANFQLTLASIGDFHGTVALTCAPIKAAISGSCSLLASALLLSGDAQQSNATINTITSVAQGARMHSSEQTLFACVLLPGLIFLWRTRCRRAGKRVVLPAILLTSFSLVLSSCGSGRDPHTRYTPAGTYQYQVTASSTSGTQITKVVTLNVIVTAN